MNKKLVLVPSYPDLLTPPNGSQASSLGRKAETIEVQQSSIGRGLNQTPGKRWRVQFQECESDLRADALFFEGTNDRVRR